MALLLIALVAVAEETPPNRDWEDEDYRKVVEPLFNGPPIGRRCVVGAMDRGMRFYAPNDQGRQEWVVLDLPAVLKYPDPIPTPGGLRMDPLNNWPKPVGLKCADMGTGEVRVWCELEEVIRTR